MATTVSDYRALISGNSWWGEGTVGKAAFITYSFDTVSYDTVAGSGYSDAFRASFQPLTDAEKAAARSTLQQWGDASGIRFLEADAGQGDIRFATYDLYKDPNQSGAAGYAYYPSVRLAGDYSYDSAFGGDIYLDDDVARYDTDDMTHVIVHEIGHALGLKHPFEDDPVLAPELDDTDHTVMSYTGYGPKLGPLDIDAIRYLYGGPDADGTQVASWAWDASTDTLTQTGFAAADTIRGVASADVMYGMGGDDILFGGRGRDRLDGGANDDRLFGDAGDDILDGGDGNDTLRGDAGNDRLTGGAGDDVIDTGDGDDVAFGGRGADTLDGGAGRDQLDGGDGKDSLTGRAGADRLVGGAGDDTLYGGDGDDVLVGGLGDDWLIGSDGGGSALDEIDTADFSAAASGIVVSMTGTYDRIDNTWVYYNAKGADIGYDNFNSIENVIGGAADDVIAGDDYANDLDGRGGADRMSGGAGGDTYRVNSIRDVVIEATGQGRDTLISTVSYLLAAGQEVETLQFAASTGSSKLNLVGNAFGQTLIGNAGANVLDGGLGNDVLRGGKGADTFLFSTKPGTGNVDHIADFAVEDTVRLSKNVFTALVAGELADTAFKNGSIAKVDLDDRIIYRQTTGELFYDPDGSGKAASVKIAVFDNKVMLTADDFLIG